MGPQRFTIDPVNLEKHNLTPSEFVLILAYVWQVNLEDAAYNMVRFGTARSEMGFIAPNQIALDRFYAALNDSTELQMGDKELEDLAYKLKIIYPKGKQPGTDVYWTEGVQLIMARLRAFFRRYGEYPAKEIIEATQQYVKDMDGKMFMKTLKYFIYKEPMTKSGEVEPSSDLYNYLEHKGEVSNSLDPNWTGIVK